MLNSALDILKHFVPADILRFNFEYFEIIRTDVEEVFYLVAIHGNWFLVFETDYVMNQLRTYNEAAAIVKDDFTIEGWIAANSPESIIYPSDSAPNEGELIKTISFKCPNNHLRYATLKLTPRMRIMQFGPTSYGH